MNYSNYLKQLNEGYKKSSRKLRESKKTTKKKLKEWFASNDVYDDLLDRANTIAEDDPRLDIDDIVAQAIDDGLIYDDDIFDLAKKYLRGSDIIDLFYQDLFSDLVNDVEIPEDDEEDLEESKKSIKGRTLKEKKEQEYKIEYWIDEEARDEGLGEIYLKKFANLNDAKRVADRLFKEYASVEVLDINDNVVYGRYPEEDLK